MGSKPDSMKLFTNMFQCPLPVCENSLKYLLMSSQCIPMNRTSAMRDGTISSRLILNILNIFFIQSICYLLFFFLNGL